MKSKMALGAALLLVSTLISCAGGNHPFPTTPKFLVAIDGTGAGKNVNVFPINATSGVLGAAATGAPFDMSLTDPMTVAVHPNGHSVYVADGNDGSIHQWDVDESTGKPTDIAAKVVNESGSFYEPVGSGDSATQVLTVTPAGKYLYSANNDATVGAYSIGSNGALTHIADISIGACASGDPDTTGAITATDDFVWVTDTCANEDAWYVFTLKIGANGSLSNASNVALTNVFSWLWSIQVNPAAGLLYVGDEGGNAQIYGYKIASDGSLTQLTLGQASPQFKDDSDGSGRSSDCRDMWFSPDGKFFYWTDDDDYVHSMTVNTTSGAIAEQAVPASPYQVQAGGAVTYYGGEGQIVVDETGKFVYAAEVFNNNSVSSLTGGVLTFTRDNTTGALTMVGTTDTATANNQAVALGIVR